MKISRKQVPGNVFRAKNQYYEKGKKIKKVGF